MAAGLGLRLGGRRVAWMLADGSLKNGGTVTGREQWTGGNNGPKSGLMGCELDRYWLSPSPSVCPGVGLSGGMT